MEKIFNFAKRHRKVLATIVAVLLIEPLIKAVCIVIDVQIITWIAEKVINKFAATETKAKMAATLKKLCEFDGTNIKFLRPLNFIYDKVYNFYTSPTEDKVED